MQSMNNILKQTTDWEKNFRGLKLLSMNYVISQFKELSGADMWKNRAFYDKSMKLGTWPD